MILLGHSVDSIDRGAAAPLLRIHPREQVSALVHRRDQRSAPSSMAASDGARRGVHVRYHISSLVHFETTPDVRSAIEREKELKGWRREKKLALIEEQNAGWHDLAADWFG